MDLPSTGPAPGSMVQPTFSNVPSVAPTSTASVAGSSGGSGSLFDVNMAAPVMQHGMTTMPPQHFPTTMPTTVQPTIQPGMTTVPVYYGAAAPVAGGYPYYGQQQPMMMMTPSPFVQQPVQQQPMYQQQPLMYQQQARPMTGMPVQTVPVVSPQKPQQSGQNDTFAFVQDAMKKGVK